MWQGSAGWQRYTVRRSRIQRNWSMPPPAHLVGLRTVFNAVHRFPPQTASSVLACAVQTRPPITFLDDPFPRLDPAWVSDRDTVYEAVPLDAGAATPALCDRRN